MTDADVDKVWKFWRWMFEACLEGCPGGRPGDRFKSGEGFWLGWSLEKNEKREPWAPFFHVLCL